MLPVILSGGVGSRLWPVSRKLHPKPFIKLKDGYSIIQNAFKRVVELGSKEIINVTNKEILFKIQNEFNELGINSDNQIKNTYILEPFGRGTAAAMAITSLWVAEKYGEEEALLVMPSDHLIADQGAFYQAVDQALVLAARNRIATFGIKPSAPETGYGYINYQGDSVKGFVEKPTLAKAKEYCESGEYLWNSGMFCFKAKVLLAEMEKYAPDILAQAIICYGESKNIEGDNFYIDPASFEVIREDSIDYAIMEKSDKISVVPCDIGWSDIGNWVAMSQITNGDENGNVLSAETILNKVTNCYIEGNNRLIAAVGVNNLAIVDTPDALLVANKDNIQDVKKIYNDLAKLGHQAHELHSTTHRPWGSYTILDEGANFKIKRIEVAPGARLSLQSHRYRAEHWVVVSGRAMVVNGDREIELNISESVYIPLGNKHRLSNPSGSEKLVIIEVQTGEYLGEDDIIRYDDIYGRVS